MPDVTLATLGELEHIRRVIVQYGQLLDDGRFEEWGALFAEDAEFWSIPGDHLPGGGRIRGRMEIVRSVAAVGERLQAQGRLIHFGGSPIIDVDGVRARAWWDFVVVQTGPVGAEIPFSGRYYADLVRTGERWRFCRRVSVRPGHCLPEGIAPAPSD